MNLQPQIDLLIKLGDLGDEIPGLSIDPIIENMVEQSEEIKSYYESVEEEVQENIDRGMDQKEALEEAKEQKKEVIEKYKENIKTLVQEKIGEIKNQYKIFKDSIKSIPDDVKSTVANLASPAVVTVPPGVNNPINIVNEVKKAINLFTGTLNIAILAFAEIIKAANTILFQIPQSILDTVETISTINNAIGTLNSVIP
jgi:F0F1-type ATP synthase membrane subunit b/b'